MMVLIATAAAGLAARLKYPIRVDESGGDPFSVLPIMSAERVRRATQIANDLSLDLQTVDVGIDTPGIVELFNAVDDLQRRLAILLQR
jgi:hypothetical protein